MNTFFGLKVIEDPTVPPERPKIQIRPQIPCSDNFRAEMNAWLAETFGHEPNVLMLAGVGYVMNPILAAKMRERFGVRKYNFLG